VDDFTVPTVTFLSNGVVSIWGGLGSNSPDIQDGVTARTDATNMYMIYFTWIQYAGGGTGAGYDSAIRKFDVNAGDSIYTEEWACDSSGSVSSSGGYGCFYLQDNTTNPPRSVTCNTPTGSCPSIKLQAGYTFSGNSAEAVVERPLVGGTSAPFPDYGSVTQTFYAEDSNGDTLYYGNDSGNATIVTLVNSACTPMESNAWGMTDTMAFTWIRSN
jgi:hypothetical protein